MRIGIMTLFDLYNVGNRLQNYAVNSFLSKIGCTCTTLAPTQPIKSVAIKKQYYEICEKLLTQPKNIQQNLPRQCKNIRFELFTKKYIPYTERPTGILPSSFSDQYDYFVCGSDQVWNPYFTSTIGQLNNFLLSFSQPHKRICFAPSIGVDNIPDCWIELYEKELSHYRYLSSREQSGADLISKITGYKATSVLDPTLMISQEEWRTLAQPLPGFDYEQPYILYYLLGNPQDELPTELLDFIEKEKKEKKLRTIRVFDPDNPTLLSAGPQEFIHLIANASLICTDSFHGTVFSILFKKPFLLVERELRMRCQVIDMSSRFKTLLNKLGLEERLPQYQLPLNDDIWYIDWEMVDDKLKEERKISEDFLFKSFNRKEYIS